MAEELSPLSRYEAERQEAFDLLKSSLDARKNQSFDPTMLAMAQGFLAPTKTGGFGESLSAAAGNVGQVQRQEQEDLQKNAKARFEIALAQADMAKKMAAAKGFGSMVAPQGQPQGQTQGQTEQQGQPAEQQGQPRSITVNDALRFAAAFPDEKEYAKMLLDAAKAGSERYKIAMNGTVFDTQTGQYIGAAVPGQTASEYNIPGVGMMKMTPTQYSQYEEARQKGMGQEWLKDFVNPAGPKKGEAPIKSQAELEAEAAGQRESATQLARSSAGRTTSVFDKGVAAGDKIANYKSMLASVNKPGMDKVLGYFEHPDFLSLAGKFIEQGRFGLPAIREILMNFQAPQEVINNLNVLQSQIGQAQVDVSALAKGQGAISDYERSLFASIPPNIKDPIQAFRTKLSMLETKAEFERNLARELRSSGKSYDEFIDSPRYETLRNSYYKRLENVINPQKEVTQTGAITSADLKARLGLK